ncbi:hypothetical protein Csa_015152 [Cucumis sativus]|uniref:Uncharacterized protein n=1 Tax=Cucumis sativus TaxID=3659 RepID=A0A0A0KY59_CUCSA|nr:hypothetical protein Csa_015152 [Cucumis sativus]
MATAAAPSTTAMTILILTLTISSYCNAASVLPSNFANETITAMTSTIFCNGLLQQCFNVEENGIHYYSTPRTGSRASSVCGRFYNGSYIKCITTQGSPKPKDCRSAYDRTCSS